MHIFPIQMSASASEHAPLLSAAEARGSLPLLSYELIVPDPSDEMSFPKKVKYLHYLIARGRLDDLRAHLDPMTETDSRDLVDATLMETYYGNTLHTALFWNTGDDAVAIFTYLISRGATIQKNYYEEYPWEQKGKLYSCSLNSEMTVGRRNEDEFEETLLRVRIMLQS